MKRRAILKYTALATGAVVGAPIALSLFSCNNDVAQMDDFSPSFLSVDQFNLVTKIADLILPKTNSPSASEVGVSKIIDHMLHVVFKSEEQTAYIAGLNTLAQFLNRNTLFVNTKSNEQIKLIQQIEDGKEESSMKEIYDAYIQLKQQTIAYYLSNETIAEKYLNYLPVPGEYKGCIPLDEAGNKAWAI
ncbi:MAG: gluconate 2-dehydrogenase subunit 3 family protein [Bacteroidota bacterium]